MFLMPSRFEPCGLGQLIAMRYGAVPVARRVGGLADTVSEGAAGTGFVFDEYSSEAMLAALDRATLAFGDALGWRELQLRGMSRDSSWDAAAREYVTMYEDVLSRG
jgi:starch synthase